jgi:decaprenyl-phosphate phosphoribosyltransferase
MKIVKDLVRALRPRQWTKNLLVAAAPIAAGQFNLEVKNIGVGLIGFCAASSFGYLLNDWKDRKSDYSHPKKRLRPFASGVLNFKNLIILLLVCAFVIIISCLVLPHKFSLSILAYLITTISYTFVIKSIPVLEMLWLSSGFLIRAIAGSAIIQKSPTGWFLVTVGFGALFIVSAKRLGELKSNYASVTRKVIDSYNESFLNAVLTASLTITLLTYSLWVFEIHPNSVLAQFTIFSFSLSVFIYAWQCETSDAESPEILLLSNKMIVLSALATIFPILITVYL